VLAYLLTFLRRAPRPEAAEAAAEDREHACSPA